MIQKIKKSILNTLVIVVFLALLTLPDRAFGQQNFGETAIRFYEKSEFNWGLLYKAGKEREELNTEVSKQFEETSTNQIKFQINTKRWTFLDYKQEQLDFGIELGSLWGNGNFIDSTTIENRTAVHSILGIRFNGAINYENRFYYTTKSYTVIQVQGKGNFDLFNKHSQGSSIDSNNVATDFDIKTDRSKFRYGFSARAGWGAGRLNPMNHVMVAEYIFDNYYTGRNFEKNEADKIIQQIDEIKSKRTIAGKHDIEMESDQLFEILNKQLFLTRPEGFEKEWKFGEYLPRFDGSRIEIGPFFKSSNREPDFIYGGYIQVNHEKYCNYTWNRRFNAGLNYNWYKTQDWMLAEIDLGWSYYKNLKSQVDFGLKYVPGIILNYFEDIEKVNHGFIPYIGYYSQINELTRINIFVALRISEDNGLLLPGPEFSVAVYRSRY